MKRISWFTKTLYEEGTDGRLDTRIIKEQTHYVTTTLGQQDTIGHV